MFIKIWKLIVLYIDRIDWRAGHLTTTERTGMRGIYQQKIALRPGLNRNFGGDVPLVLQKPEPVLN